MSNLSSFLFISAGCYPFTDRDPFFVETCPHVYFIGNQDKYETSLIKGKIFITFIVIQTVVIFCFTADKRNVLTLTAGSDGQVVRLICIPKFAETGTAVVVSSQNVRT